MIIGVPKEIKDNEYRVGLVPAGVQALRAAGHRVLVQEGAGRGCGLTDEAYRRAGAEVVSRSRVFDEAEMIIKVKEPQPSEFDLLKEGQILFTYLHLAAVPDVAAALVERKVIAVAYETLEAPDGSLPLLTPMSEVAGRLAVQVGARYLQKDVGGRGVLLAGVPGVSPGGVVIIGGGVVGTSAARIALGMGAEVTILDVDLNRLRYLDDIFSGRLRTLVSNAFNIEQEVPRADLLIGAVLQTGARAPRLVSRPLVEKMMEGSVIVDVAVDQGGCVETIRATCHSDPVYTVAGVIHYGVTNMPAVVARTSTFALTNATLPYALRIAGSGFPTALTDPEIASGLNTYLGAVTHPSVARDLGYDYVSPSKL